MTQRGATVTSNQMCCQRKSGKDIMVVSTSTITSTSNSLITHTIALHCICYDKV
jgi:hypothetical protein